MFKDDREQFGENALQQQTNQKKVGNNDYLIK